MKWHLLAIFGLLGAPVLAGCASRGGYPKITSPENPPPAEVQAYVKAHWGEYIERFARFSARPAERAALVSISAVSCQPYYVVSDCSFDVTATFGEGDLLTRRMSSHFDRISSGQLRETILMVHELKR